MKKIFPVLLFCLLACPWPVHAVDPNTPTSPPLLKSWGEDAFHMAQMPAQWGPDQWTKAAWLIAGTTSLFFLDDSVDKNWQDLRSPATDRLADGGHFLGDPWTLLVVSGGIVASGQLYRDCYLRETGLQALESWLFTNVTTLGIKHLTRRFRPNSGKGSDNWDGPGWHDRPGSGEPDGYSFPSGHTAGSFALASVITERYPDSIWLKWSAYGLASLVALSRINDHEHWASDVFAGAALGWSIGKGVVRLNQKNSSRITLLPFTQHKIPGLALVWKF